MGKNPHALTPNPWDDVQVRNGKLIGMLNDKLADNTMPRTGGDGTSSRLTEVASLGVPKVFKKPPSKFK